MTINTATAIKAVKTPRTKAKQAVVKPVYDHEQGNVIMPKPLSSSTELSLIGLPAPSEATDMPIGNLELANSKQSFLIVRFPSSSKTANKLADAKPAKVSRQFKDPYGKRIPNEGTSARAIWDALIEHGYIVGDSNKAWVYKLAMLDLQCDKGPVHYVNLTSEINSYRKYLLNHDWTIWPSKAA